MDTGTANTGQSTQAYVSRNHIVEVVKGMLDASACVTLDGDEGIGISSFLSEFISSSPLYCITSMIR